MECPWGSWGSSSRGFLTARSIPHASPAGLRHTPTKRWGSVFPPPESGQSSDCSPQWKWCHVTQEGRSSKEHSFFPACPFRMLALGKPASCFEEDQTSPHGQDHGERNWGSSANSHHQPPDRWVRGLWTTPATSLVELPQLRSQTREGQIQAVPTVSCLNSSPTKSINAKIACLLDITKLWRMHSPALRARTCSCGENKQPGRREQSGSSFPDVSAPLSLDPKTSPSFSPTWDKTPSPLSLSKDPPHIQMTDLGKNIFLQPGAAYLQRGWVGTRLRTIWNNQNTAQPANGHAQCTHQHHFPTSTLEHFRFTHPRAHPP